MLVVAQVSDIHLDGSARNAERAARVMTYLNELPHPIDAVLVTGDIADNGLESEYEEARKILVSPHPVFICPGNHDIRSAYRRILLGEPAGEEPINRAHHVGGAVFALCDSSVPGRPEGFLADETIEWLDSLLAADPESPAFVCFHHPPLPLHVPYVDEIRQHGEERLAEVIARHPQIVAVLCGHAHTGAATTFAGRPLLVAPGVVSTLLLSWESDTVVDYDLPPAVTFHILGDDLRLTTHYRAVPVSASAG
jgi:3',5'-cyclic-AMP phosphodiesterase